MAVKSTLRRIVAITALCFSGLGCMTVWAETARASARTTIIPICTMHVDSAAPANGDGTVSQPFQRIAEAVATAAEAAIICVAEGTYPEQLLPGTKAFTLAGGFQSNAGFAVRDSALYTSTAKGSGGSFLKIVDPGPTADQLTAIDGFEITGYSQAIVRDHWESQRFDITNNFIHDNVCADQSLAGAGFALVNVSGAISGNLIQRNACGRGGAGFLNDSTNNNSVTIENNIIDANAGTEPEGSHGGGLYLFGNTLTITSNVFTNNSVTQWGGGLYVGAYTPGNQPTTATLSHNIYRGNRAGDGGGGFFCDDGATCIASYETYDSNCGGNILLDGGAQGYGATVSRFDHIKNLNALSVDCGAPGNGVFIDTYEVVAPDIHTFTNSVFWGNAVDGDFATACTQRCEGVTVSVESSIVQTRYGDGGIKINFGAGNTAPENPVAAPPVVATVAEIPATTVTEPSKSGNILPAVQRGASYMGFEEKFNRYYTDTDWKPTTTVYVSPTGGGDGTTRELPTDPKAALAAAQPGTLIHFTPGEYQGGLELGKELSGTHDAPIVLFGEAAASGGIGVKLDCNIGKRKSCFNLEGADYVAIHGFEFAGGVYGVRIVGLGFDASQHSRGIAVIGNTGHDQQRDPFFSGQSDWNVWERNLAYGAKEDDGHGIYITNGSDWNIVSNNELHSNASSGFQINADPASTCVEDGVANDDPRCDAYAGEGEGGRGASDFMLVENNYFHHSDVGSNFTSVRKSVIRNNIFGPQTRHNVSFWQETENPKLAASDNVIVHNLFFASRRHGVSFTNSAARNLFVNNVILGVKLQDNNWLADPEALIMDVDETSGDNSFASNFYAAGQLVGRAPNETERTLPDVSADWFTSMSTTIDAAANGFNPTAVSPYVNIGSVNNDALVDRMGTARAGAVDLGPFEIP